MTYKEIIEKIKSLNDARIFQGDNSINDIKKGFPELANIVIDRKINVFESKALPNETIVDGIVVRHN
jgi:hypothetical protein